MQNELLQDIIKLITNTISKKVALSPYGPSWRTKRLTELIGNKWLSL